MPTKPKKNQPETPKKSQVRDLFQTPNFAVDLLTAYFPTWVTRIWDASAGYNGEGKITKRLSGYGYTVYGTDIRGDRNIHNFLDGYKPETIDSYENLCFVMNPPYSLKKKFYVKLLEISTVYNICWALLIPADYTGWLIEAVAEQKCEKIIPDRRINYITPNILLTIKRRELWEQHIKHDYPHYDKINKIGKDDTTWEYWYTMYNWHNEYDYVSIDKVPSWLLYKHSSAQFHSMWLTWGFDLKQSETFVSVGLNYCKDNM